MIGGNISFGEFASFQRLLWCYAAKTISRTARDVCRMFV